MSGNKKYIMVTYPNNCPFLSDMAFCNITKFKCRFADTDLKLKCPVKEQSEIVVVWNGD